jgi:hypothetical protein
MDVRPGQPHEIRSVAACRRVVSFPLARPYGSPDEQASQLRCVQHSIDAAARDTELLRDRRGPQLSRAGIAGACRSSPPALPPAATPADALVGSSALPEVGRPAARAVGHQDWCLGPAGEQGEGGEQLVAGHQVFTQVRISRHSPSSRWPRHSPWSIGIAIGTLGSHGKPSLVGRQHARSLISVSTSASVVVLGPR